MAADYADNEVNESGSDTAVNEQKLVHVMNIFINDSDTNSSFESFEEYDNDEN